MPAQRTESDGMGEMTLPADAYWGAQTQRAVENFPISGYRFGRRFIRALGLIKWAAARANHAGLPSVVLLSTMPSAGTLTQSPRPITPARPLERQLLNMTRREL